MQRATTALLTALEAVVAVAVGLLVPVAAIGALWAAHFGFAGDALTFWRAAVDVWLLGHGVPIDVGLDIATQAALGAPADVAVFVVSAPPLLAAAVTAIFGISVGRRSHGDQWQVVLPSGVLTVAGVSWLLAASARVTGAGPDVALAVVLPALVYGGGIAAGVLRRRATRGDIARSPLGDLVVAGWVRIAEPVRGVAAAAVPGIGAALLALTAAAALGVVVAIAVAFPTVVGLYESGQLGVLGSALVTIVQLAYLPTLLAWALSWLAGPGFAVGVGTIVSPAGVDLGPLPALPVLGALPTSHSVFGLVVVLVPVVAGVLAGRLVALRDALARGAVDVAATAATIGIATGAVVGLAVWWAHGAIGPGRLEDVGGNGAIVGGAVAIEVAIGAAIGLVSLRRTAGDAALPR